MDDREFELFFDMECRENYWAFVCLLFVPNLNLLEECPVRF